MKIAIVDYGLSNLLSVKRAFEYYSTDVVMAASPKEIESVQMIVLPGVGAFKDGMKGLVALGLDKAIIDTAAKGVPVLGICLGMQMLFEESDEDGVHKGLGLIKGRVEKIPNEDIYGRKQCVPHIGWNKLVPANSHNSFKGELLDGIDSGEEVYFVHSFEGKPENPDNRMADTIYGGRTISAIVANNAVLGCQFHPEKSGQIGLKIIENFINGYK